MIVLVYTPLRDVMLLRDIPETDIEHRTAEDDTFCIGYQPSTYLWLYSTDLLLLTTNLEILEPRWSEMCIASIEKLRAEKYDSFLPEDVIDTISLL